MIEWLLRLSFASLLWSPARFKGKEKKPRKFSVCVALCLIQGAIFTLSLFCLFVCWDVCQKSTSC